MGLRRLELRLGSAVRRPPYIAGLPSQRTVVYTADEIVDTSGWNPAYPAVIEGTGTGGTAGNGLGGGGGANAQVTLVAPFPPTVRIAVALNAIVLDDSDQVILKAVSGQNGADGGFGGSGGDCTGDVTHGGGDGTADGGGQPARPTSDGRPGASDGVTPGSGGNPPEGVGVPGQVVITYRV